MIQITKLRRALEGEGECRRRRRPEIGGSPTRRRRSRRRNLGILEGNFGGGVCIVGWRGLVGNLRKSDGRKWGIGELRVEARRGETPCRSGNARGEDAKRIN